MRVPIQNADTDPGEPFQRGSMGIVSGTLRSTHIWCVSDSAYLKIFGSVFLGFLRINKFNEKIYISEATGI
jgi:hypothetical protein